MTLDQQHNQVRPGSGEMFDQIALRYDLLNRLMSFGVDRNWRKKTVRALSVAGKARVLDVATGTADLALSIAKMYPEAEVIGVDPSLNMLAVGRSKIKNADLEERAELYKSEAERLPFEDNSFDASCIAFGIRNVSDRLQGLKEMSRVTKPGGRVVVLELSEPQSGWMSPLARFHIHRVVPRLGAWLSGSQEYLYLEESIAAFPTPDQFAVLMAEAGLEVLEIESLTFGVCCLFVAQVCEPGRQA